nr:MAG TPA: hypothetical protein [Caudoviricetes sp.]
MPWATAWGILYVAGDSAGVLTSLISCVWMRSTRIPVPTKIN